MPMANLYGYSYPQQGAAPDILSQYKMPYQVPIPPQTQPQPQSNFLWVQGEQAAKSYLVAPGNTVVLWDSENPYIYIKTADVSGMPSIKILEYKERGEALAKAQEHTCHCGEMFVTKEDFKVLSERVEALASRIEKEVNDNA